MKKIIKQTFIIIVIALILIIPYFVFAQEKKGTMKGVLETVGNSAGYLSAGVDETSFAGFLGMIVSVFLGILGVIFVILIVIAGNKWMTAGGEEEKVREAKDTIRRAIIGLIIIVGAYAIWAYVAIKLLS
jgi:cytochrome bd-type quinol oxidase subunit 2